MDQNSSLNQNDKEVKHEAILVLCMEKNCLIIDFLKFVQIEEIISKLKTKKLSILNASLNHNSKNSFNDYQTNEEIINFCSHFYREISHNEFINLTIEPVICYLIRRYFYPSTFFKDQSFFSFDSNIYQKEQSIKLKLQNIL